MKIYHVETQEDYDALMVELEEQGVLWDSGVKPTSLNHWIDYKEDTTVHLEDEKVITYASLGFVEGVYPNTPIQKYKEIKGYNERTDSMYPKQDDIPNKLLRMMEEHIELGLSLISFLDEATHVSEWISSPRNQNLLVKKWLQLVDEHDEYNKPPNHQDYTDVVDTMTETYNKKNADYGNSFEESLDMFGRVTGVARIYDKFNRVKNIAQGKEMTIVDESEIDDYMDIANYCIMMVMWLNKQNEGVKINE